MLRGISSIPSLTLAKISNSLFVDDHGGDSQWRETRHVHSSGLAIIAIGAGAAVFIIVANLARLAV